MTYHSQWPSTNSNNANLNMDIIRIRLAWKKIQFPFIYLFFLLTSLEKQSKKTSTLLYLGHERALNILSILDLVVWSHRYYLYYCSSHYLIHHFKREQKRTALKLEYTYKFFWLKFKQQEWATIYCWSLSCWMRETLVVKYIDLDIEILPKKPGEKKEMQI